MLALEIIAGDSPRVAATWRALEARAEASYFLSWGWIENWLACLPAALRPQLAVLRGDGEAVAACFLSRHSTIRHHVWPCRSVVVNATGSARFDELTIEHNGLLRVRGGPTMGDLIERLPGGWDELVLPGIDARELPGHVAGAIVEIDRAVPSPYVDLERVRASAGGYVALLRSAARAQLRRARRATGEVRIERAADRAAAHDILDELVALHQASWVARGERGAFADPWFLRFHRRLIDQRFSAGELDLVRVTAQDETIGCLYGFRYRGGVAFYQSGLAPTDDPRAKYGHVCHAAAIEDAARRGDRVYDFLGGDARYKRELATDETTLVWARVRRPLWRFALEDWLRAVSAARSTPAGGRGSRGSAAGGASAARSR